MHDRLDSEAVGRVLRRAMQIEEAAGSGDDTSGGVSPEALVAAAGEVGIDPDAVSDALVLERIDGATLAPRRLDRLVGGAEVVVRRSVERSADEALDAVAEWLTTAHQMRAARTGSGMIELWVRGGVAASFRRATAAFFGDAHIHPIDRIVVEAHAQQHRTAAGRPRSIVNISAHRRTTRARHLGAGAAAAVAGLGTAVVGIAESVAFWPVASVPLVVGGALVVRAGGSHATRVELELTRMLSAVDRSEHPTGIVGRAARRARAALRAVRSNPQ